MAKIAIELKTGISQSSVRRHTVSESSSERSNKAYAQLKKLAQEFRSRSMAKIAIELKTGGHFDKVITMIDEMIGLLRKEEQEDIEHRDRCEGGQNANKNEMSDLKSNMQKTKNSLKRMGNTKKELEGEIAQLEKDIKATKDDMAQLLKMRNKDVAA